MCRGIGAKATDNIALLNWDLSGLQRALAVLEQILSQGLAMYQPQEETYAHDVEKIYQRLKARIGQSSNASIRKVAVASCPQGPVVIANIEGMVDEQRIDQDVVGRLLTTTAPPREWGTTTVTHAQYHPPRNPRNRHY